jgi:hypothetical protein
MRVSVTIFAFLLVFSLSLVIGTPRHLPYAFAQLGRDQGPIEQPGKLPIGKLIGDTLYCMVLPAVGIDEDESPVDWEYGLWKYSLKAKRAELLLPYERYPWLIEAWLPSLLPDGSLLLEYQPWQDYELEDDFKHLYIVDSAHGSPVKEVTLTAYDFERFGMWGYIDIYGEWAILKHPHFFKVLTVDALLNEKDSGYIVDIPLYVRKDGEKELYPINNNVFPLKLADDSVSPFLVLDEFYGFRILDSHGRLLYQGGQVFSDMFATRFFGLTRDYEALYRFIRASYPESLEMVLYVAPDYIAMTEENLVVFYDSRLECVFICSPLGDFYEKVDIPDEYYNKRIAGAGLTGEDGYTLVFDDGWSTFTADYSEIAQQVREGKLDPLGTLREMMKAENK